MSQIHFWLRDEVKPNEHRSPLTPKTAAELIKAGYKLSVEKSTTRFATLAKLTLYRIFTDDEFQKVGATLVEGHSWPRAPKDAFILGLKELPLKDERPGIPNELNHRHIYFAHCYKGQSNWKESMGRFTSGGGELLDLEFLFNDNGRRVAAFGHSAGFAGMAVGLLVWIHRQLNGDKIFPKLSPFKSKELLISHIKSELEKVPGKKKPSILVLGALGRCGRGSVELATSVGLEPIQWDLNETKKGGPFPELLQVDILVNDIYLMGKIPPFIDVESLEKSTKDGTRKLSVFVDVSCDVTNPNNPFPFVNKNTTFDVPVLTLYGNDKNLKPLDVIAIDHLPTFIPKESSTDFAEQLIPHLKNISKIDWTKKPSKEMGEDHKNTTEAERVWLRARALFSKKVEELNNS